MIGKVKLRIEEDEWVEVPVTKRERIIELMKEYGYDTSMLELMEQETKGPNIQDVYRQFYGDE